MARTDALKEKILKLGSKQKLGALVKYADNPEDDVRMTPITSQAWPLSRSYVILPPWSELPQLLLLPIFTPSIAKNMLKNLLLQTLILT